MKNKFNKIAFSFFAFFVLVNSGNAQTCNFSLGNDTAICQGVPINFNLTAPSGATAYLWDNASITATRHVSTYGTYYCRLTKNGTNIVTNGNFNSGNTGFTSGYTVGTGGSFGPISNAGTFLVTTNAHTAHTNFPSFGNHTTLTSGNMLVVNGSPIPNVSVWCQNIAVTPNTNYNFSSWVATCAAANISELAVLQFSINGAVIGTPFSPIITTGIWSQFNAQWNSGANTTAAICIVNQNVNPSGNDFALDDIFFQPVCVFTDTLHVTSKPFPTGYSAGLDAQICSGLTAPLIATNGDGNSFSWASRPPGFTSTSLSNSVSPNDTTTYFFTSELNGCKKLDSAIVFVIQTPTPFAGSDDAICDGKSVTLTGNAGGGATFSWTSTPPGFVSSQLNPTVTPSVTTRYKLSVSNGVCSASDSVEIIVNTAPVADFLIQRLDSSCNSYTIFFDNKSSNSLTSFWDFGDGVLSGDVSPIHVYQAQNIFNVKLISKSTGCESIKIIPLKISFSENALFVPSSFTPNLDLKNDTFYIPKGCLETVTVSIYDRWGLLVKQWSGLDGFWDGKHNGEFVPEGAYVYLLDGIFLSGERIRKKATLTVFH